MARGEKKIRRNLKQLQLKQADSTFFSSYFVFSSFPLRASGNICMWSNCEPHLGPTECYHFRCVCRTDFVYSEFVKQCVHRYTPEGMKVVSPQDTGATCHLEAKTNGMEDEGQASKACASATFATHPLMPQASSMTAKPSLQFALTASTLPTSIESRDVKRQFFWEHLTSPRCLCIPGFIYFADQGVCNMRFGIDMSNS